MKSLGDLIKNSGGSPLWKKVGAAMVVEETNALLTKMFGEESAKYARAMYVKNNVLAIACLSSVVAQEIRLNQKKIAEEINNKFGSGTVQSIKYLS